MASVRLPCPPPDEQRIIADHLDVETSLIRGAMEAINHQITLLGERRQALITAAVTGRLSVDRLS